MKVHHSFPPPHPAQWHERTCVLRCEQPEQGEHEQPHRSACRGGEGCGDDGEGSAAHRHRAAVLLEQVGAEGAAVGLDCGEQRRPAARALAWRDAHGRERAAARVRVAQALHAEGGDGGMRDARHLEVAAIVGEGQRGGRRVVHFESTHHAWADDGVLDVRACAQQVLSLVVPRLRHRAQPVDQDREDRPRGLALARDAHDAAAGAGGLRRLDDRAHSLVVDELTVRRVRLRIQPEVAQLPLPAGAVHREARRAALQQQAHGGGVVHVALHRLDAWHRRERCRH
mmetsp:Transcript_29294/g.69576  ORF Transcript_29294/g.69576 Transcript_29294/m.69576 type:complete len:284 (-) Transcript_29294:209-1060(-)